MKMKIDYILSLGTFNPKTERIEPKLNRSVGFLVLWFNFGFIPGKFGFGSRVLRTEHPKEPILIRNKKQITNVSLLSRY
jgi:hypothetical protein